MKPGLAVACLAGAAVWACAVSDRGAGGSGAGVSPAVPQASRLRNQADTGQDAVQVEVRPLGKRPIAYFERACAGCHGEEGTLYPPGFGDHLTDEALTEVIRKMAAGPAQARIEGRELDAQTAYHRAIIAGEPFLVFVGAEGEDLLFEASPGATVTAVREGKTLAVRRASPTDESENALWLVPNVQPLTVTAAREKKKATLDPMKAAWSHAKPH